VEVGDDRDREPEIGGPLRRLYIVPGNTKPQLRLDAESVSRGRSAEGAETGEETKQLAA
jgi:hypothetical protein